MTADPHTGRATERYANAAHCRLAGGASVEAHLAAVAANALPEHMTQLDHLLRCGGSVCACAFVRVCVCIRAHASAVLQLCARACAFVCAFVHVSWWVGGCGCMRAVMRA